MKRLLTVILLLSFLVPVLGDDDSMNFEDTESIVRYLKSMELAFKEVKSYKAIMFRQIRVEDELLEKERLLIFFKKPFSIKLINTSNQSKVIYVEGQHNDKMQVRLKTFLGNYIKMRLDPDGKLAMKDELHTIREAGLGRVIELINKNIEKGILEEEINLSFLGSEEKYKATLLSFQGIFNAPENSGYFCKKAIIKVDAETRLPREIKIYNWEGKLREWYEYVELRLNIKINDNEFSF